MITLRNDFHGTAARVSPKRGILTPSQVRRVRRKLCPSHAQGCTCGDSVGARGPNDWSVDVDPGGVGHMRAVER